MYNKDDGKTAVLDPPKMSDSYNSGTKEKRLPVDQLITEMHTSWEKEQLDPRQYKQPGRE